MLASAGDGLGRETESVVGEPKSPLGVTQSWVQEGLSMLILGLVAVDAASKAFAADLRCILTVTVEGTSRRDTLATSVCLLSGNKFVLLGRRSAIAAERSSLIVTSRRRGRDKREGQCSGQISH